MGNQHMSSDSNLYPGIRHFKMREHSIFFGRDDELLELRSRLTYENFVALIGQSSSGKSSLIYAGLMGGLKSKVWSEKKDWTLVYIRASSSEEPFLTLKNQLVNKALVKENTDFSKIKSEIKKDVDSYSLHDCLLENTLGIDKPFLLVIDQFEQLFVNPVVKQIGSAEPSDEKEHNPNQSFIQFILNTVSPKEKYYPNKIYVLIALRSEELQPCANYPGLVDKINNSFYYLPFISRDNLKQAIVNIQKPELVAKLCGIDKSYEDLRNYEIQVDDKFSDYLLDKLYKKEGENTQFLYEPDKLSLLQYVLHELFKQEKQRARTRAIDSGAKKILLSLNEYNKFLHFFCYQSDPKKDELEGIFNQCLNRDYQAEPSLENGEKLSIAIAQEIAGILFRRLVIPRCKDDFSVYDNDPDTSFLGGTVSLDEIARLVAVHKQQRTRVQEFYKKDTADYYFYQSTSLEELNKLNIGEFVYRQIAFDDDEIKNDIEVEKPHVAAVMDHFKGILRFSHDKSQCSFRHEAIIRQWHFLQKFAEKERDLFEVYTDIQKEKLKDISATSALDTLIDQSVTLCRFRKYIRRELMPLNFTTNDKLKHLDKREQLFLSKLGKVIFSSKEYMDEKLEKEKAINNSYRQEFQLKLAQKEAEKIRLEKEKAESDNKLFAQIFKLQEQDQDAKASKEKAEAENQKLLLEKDRAEAEVKNQQLLTDNQNLLLEKITAEAENQKLLLEKERAERLQQSQAMKTQRMQSLIKVFAALLAGTFLLILIALQTIQSIRERDLLHTRSKALFDSKLTSAKAVVNIDDYQNAQVYLQESYKLEKEQGIDESRRFLRDYLTGFMKMRKISPTPFKLETPGTPLRTSALSQDGQWLAAGGSNGALVIFNTETAKPFPLALQKTDHQINAIAFEPQGRWLVTADKQGWLRQIWLKEAKEPVEINTEDELLSLAMSPDGAWLAVAGIAPEIKLWRITQEGKLEATDTTIITGGGIIQLAFSPDGKLLAAASLDKQAVQLWQLEAGNFKYVDSFSRTSKVRALAFSPDNRLLASADDDYKISIWELESKQEKQIFRGHRGKIHALAFNQEGTLLLSGSQDQSIRVWDVEAGGGALNVLQGHTADVMALARGGSYVYSAGYEGQIKKWRIPAPYTDNSGFQYLVKLNGTPTSVAISPQGKRVAVGFKAGNICLYDQGGLPLSCTESPNTGKIKSIFNLGFSNDGKQLLSAGAHNGATLWQVADAQLLEPKTFMQADWRAVYDVAFAPDNVHLVTANANGSMGWITKSSDGETIDSFPSHSGNLFRVSFNSGGAYLLSSGNNQGNRGQTRLWALQSSQPVPLPTFPESNNEILWADFSPDSKHFVEAGLNGDVNIYSFAALDQGLKPVRLLDDAEVFRVKFSQEGNALWTLNAEAKLRLWDLSKQPAEILFTLHLPTVAKERYWDFAIHCQPSEKLCRLVVPLASSQRLAFYTLDMNEPREILMQPIEPTITGVK